MKNIITGKAGKNIYRNGKTVIAKGANVEINSLVELKDTTSGVTLAPQEVQTILYTVTS